MSKKTAINLGILLAVFVALTAYFKGSKLNAERKANDFCASLKLGESGKGIREKAIAFGAHDKFSHFYDGFMDQETGKYDKAFVATFIAPRVEGRHMCDVLMRDDEMETIKKLDYRFSPTTY